MGTELEGIRLRPFVTPGSIKSYETWKLLEIRGVDEGAVLYYLRGGSSNTTNYDNEYIVFNADHTGYEVDNAGVYGSGTTACITVSIIPMLL